jgi:hypothetical protein
MRKAVEICFAVFVLTVAFAAVAILWCLSKIRRDHRDMTPLETKLFNALKGNGACSCVYARTPNGQPIFLRGQRVLERECPLHEATAAYNAQAWGEEVGKPEAKVEFYLVYGVAKRGGWAAKMVDKGRRGAPDRECRFPGGRIVYVETKCKNGRLEPWQSEYHESLRDLGFTVLLLWTIEQCDEWFHHIDQGFWPTTFKNG